jgi:phospholipid/cholesterol/gamma-HCH transport system permease protein
MVRYEKSKEIDDLVIGSLGIVAFISFFVEVLSRPNCTKLDQSINSKYLIGFATRQSVILEFAPTISVIMAGKWVLL